MDLRKLIRLAMLLSLSIVLGLIESFIPIFQNIIPGLKLGLANIVILFILYTYTFKDALYVSIVRVFLLGMIRTGLFNIIFFFSLSGALFSVIMMALAKKYTKLSIVGISVLGSISHSIGQILVAMVGLSNFNIVYYLPYLLLLSIPTGIFIGFLSRKVLTYYSSVNHE